ncbi:hypothetical protein [Sphingomonas bacterium]|uniref:hypothetical protein n=1 Tax=Sphingomonas bacterium TaxID=1895847 RepID=UPI0015770249|nr:hypothetical protein [Sphingomonas bacterium]
MRGMVMMVLALPLGGCVASTVWNAATLPVKAAAVPVRVGGKVVDWTTTSQAEADRNYGRKMRKDEEREGRERRDWTKRCKKTRGDPSCQSYDGFRAGQQQ